MQVVRSWIDTNKGFVITVITLLIAGTLAFSEVRSAAQQNEKEISRVCDDYKKYVERTTSINAGQDLGINAIKIEMSYIKTAVEKTQKTQEKMNDKIDVLLRRGN